MKFHALSWEEFHSEIFSLYQSIIESGKTYDLLIAVSRGGLTISHILSDFLHLQVASLTCTSYDDIAQKGTLKMNYMPEGDLTGKKILVVDDLSDTGSTFEAVVDCLKTRHPSVLDTCALYVKPGTSFHPIYVNKVTDAWVVFPYEVRETVQSVHAQMKKEGKTDEEVYEFLKSLKLQVSMIKEFF
jgi:hypoxanthine phosphoribosyltransferase